jgi:hypothetical protein
MQTIWRFPVSSDINMEALRICEVGTEAVLCMCIYSGVTNIIIIYLSKYIFLADPSGRAV